MNHRELNKQELKIGFIGVGVLGKGLALALADRGYRVSASFSRRSDSSLWLSERIPGCSVAASAQALAEVADLVFITTPDAAIHQVCAEVAWRPDQGVVHCCGADSRGILDSAARRQAQTGAFHPFQTLAGLKDPAEAGARLTGVSFAVEGDGWLSDLLPQMAQDLGGRAVVIPEGDRPLYHASAVLACAHLAALMHGAVTLWERMGYDSVDALEAFHPERIASRILGMGDVVSFVEKAEQAFDGEKAEKMEAKLRQEAFSFDDFREQLQAIKKMGPLDQLMGMIPGAGKALKGVQLDDNAFVQVEAIINSMTAKERVQPQILNGSRRQRIARGSGTTVQDVNRLVKQFQSMQKMVKQMSRMKPGRMKMSVPFA